MSGLTFTARQVYLRRRLAGLTQLDLALQCDLHMRTIQRLELGQVVSNATVARIAEALGCAVEDLVPQEKAVRPC